MESRIGNFDQILTLDRVRFARYTVLDGVLGHHFSNRDWLVFDWGWVVLVVINVSLLVRLLHLGAPQAERASPPLLHVVLEVVRPDVVAGRCWIALCWPYYEQKRE